MVKPCPVKRLFTVLKPENTGNHGIRKAFDNSTAPDDFFETTIDKPVEIEFDFHKPIKLNAFSFAAGEYAERMPVTWKVESSDDASNWATQKRYENVSWRTNEQKRFEIKSSRPFRYYRFVIEKSVDPHILRIYEIHLEIEGDS
jgi:hypothetical protein